jgi:hypothetical protein
MSEPAKEASNPTRFLVAGVVAAMAASICCIGPVFLLALSTCLTFAETIQTAQSSDPIVLFRVPLKCEAVPEIGCVSLAKPILLELQRQPNISEAWLNGTGTIVAVVEADASDRDSVASTVKSILKGNGADGTELTGEERETALRSFASRTDWYRGADVDRLSKREGAAIAARLVRRVQTKVSLPEATVRALVADLTQVIQERFISEAKTSKQEFEESVLKVVRNSLDEKGVAAFREAAAKGIRPLPEDKEGPGNKMPDCCSISWAGRGL